ncbi:MAG: hypothetical protein JO102_05870 [Elusimicrobia bacterium]|nr:hypothetical protein [Elusimicrobiota bacterium]
MNRSLKQILGYSALTKDGGKRPIADVLLDDRGWKTRYLVLDTGKWLAGRRVLVSPRAFGFPRWSENVIPVKLTLDQIKNSPPLEADMPVTLQHQRDLANYYEWPPTDVEQAPLPEPVTDRLTPDTQALEDWQTTRQQIAQQGDPHLQSAGSLLKSKFIMSDGADADIDDIVISDEDWHVVYWVASTPRRAPAQIEPSLVTSVNQPASTVTLMLDAGAFSNLPEATFVDKIDGALDESLRSHGGRRA